MNKSISEESFEKNHLSEINFLEPIWGFESIFLETDEDEYYIAAPYELNNIEFTSPKTAHIFHSVTNESPSEYKYDIYVELINEKIKITDYKIELSQYWGDEESYD